MGEWWRQARFGRWSAQTKSVIDAADRPDDIPRVHAAGPDPDRVLLFGSDIFVGRGVRSHEVGFAGYLARIVAASTGRGIDVAIEAHPTLIMSEAAAAARELELERFDAVLIDLGLADALAGTSPSDWSAGLEVLLQVVTERLAASARVFFIESPDPTIVPAFRSPHGTEVARSFEAFNERSREIIEGFPSVEYVPFPVSHERRGDRIHTARAFEGFATTLAPAIIAHLEAEFLSGAPRVDPVASEELRQAAVDRLGILDTAPEQRFDRIVERAQRTFGTEFAAFNVIDNDRRWSKSHVGPGAQEASRANEICNTTIHTHSGLIVPDLTKDARFSDNPAVAGDPHVRFYAGYPVEAPDGQRIGTLCVFGTETRTLDGEEESTLRELALQVERELWSMPSIKARILG